MTDDRKFSKTTTRRLFVIAFQMSALPRGSSRTVTFLLVLTGVRSTDEAPHSQRNDGMFLTTCSTGCPAPV